MLKIKKLLKFLINLFRNIKFRISLENELKKKKNLKKVYIIATPCHGNLGDHAIVYAEYDFLKDRGYEESIIEISNDDYMRNIAYIQKKINEEDIIIIDGGGNLGTLWPHEDDKISDIIKTFLNNKIVVFPQTCYYSNDEIGLSRLKRTKEIYSKHSNLTICLRDKKSFDYVQSEFKSVNAVFVPDIVLYLKLPFKKQKRNGVLFCFRNDLEKVSTVELANKLEKFMKNKNIDCKKTDTVIKKNVNKKTRYIELGKKWSEFASAELIITDRLHGMIFAAITGTPCIALDNKSQKVSGVYKWIENCESVKIARTYDEVTLEFERIYGNSFDYNNDFLKESFEKISV